MRAVVAFCRHAVRRKIPFHILAASKQDPVFQTQYRDAVFLTRDCPELDIANALAWFKAIRRKTGCDRLVILPTSEFLNRFLLEHQSTLERAGCQVPLVRDQLYHQISDKHAFARICVEHNLAVPREFESMPSQLPFVAKPLRYASTQTGKQLKPWLLTSASRLEQFEQQEQIDDFFFQELAVGKSIYLLYFVSRTGNDVLFSQENLIQQCNGGSIIAARKSTAHHEEIAQAYLQMLKQIGFWGLVMIELKATSSGYQMIEANPRLWGPLQFVVDNDVPILTQFLVECGFSVPSNPLPVTPGGAEFYFWSGGMTASAQPFIVHNDAERCFLNDYPALIRNDVYLRHDTLDLYASEIRKQP